MTSPVPVHLHTYERIKHPKGRKDLYRCIDKHCTHTINRIKLPGKAALCPYCGNEYTITYRMLNTQKLLHCANCTRKGPKTNLDVQRSVEEKLQRMLRRTIGDLDE